jgi:prepilin-type N-terminal cleavage/methylation domain-containing protein
LDVVGLMNKQKGFTLAELLVALGLLGIVISVLMSFFIAGVTNYRTINDKLELQFQAQYILDFMSSRIVESKYVELAKENTSSHLKKSGEQNISKISFRYGNNINQCYNFEIRYGKIRYGNARSSTTPTDELGVYVKKLTATPINNKKFEDTEAVKLKILLEKNKQIYEAEQTVFMRNHEIR